MTITELPRQIYKNRHVYRIFRIDDPSLSAREAEALVAEHGHPAANPVDGGWEVSVRVPETLVNGTAPLPISVELAREIAGMMPEYIAEDAPALIDARIRPLVDALGRARECIVNPPPDKWIPCVVAEIDDALRGAG